MDRATVATWVAGYERLWRAPGTGRLPELFAADVTYLPSPWEKPIRGLSGLAAYWDAERDSPDEEFTMAHEVVAVDDQAHTAVVRVFVEYTDPEAGTWRDLWVIGFDDADRCVSFEEWPFAPDQPDGH